MKRVVCLLAAASGAGAAARWRVAGSIVTPTLVLCLVAVAGCYPPEIMTVRSGLDSLRVVVDTMVVRDSVAFRAIQETRREVAEQRDILLSTRATAGSTTQELFEQMGRLEAKLDEVMGRFEQVTHRTPETVPGGAEANQIYDQASQDLTQGRYDLALRGFRDFVQRFPALDLSDNAQYGIAECLFAQSHFDSAAIEYARVDSQYPRSEKLPSALYKLALSQEKLGRTAEAKRTLEQLAERFPLSGEAQLARERLGTSRRR